MYRVIIADDEPWIAYGLVHLIDWELYGFTVCGTAEDGVDALEQCLTLKPDVLISDIRMPGMDGLELLEKLRCKMPDLIVIFVSGYSEFEYAQRAVRLGAFDYLLKPAAAEDLTGLLSRLKSPLRNIQQRAYQDSYFALLDTDNDVTIGQWTEPGSHTPNFQSCFFLTFDAAADSQQDIDYLESLITSAGHEAVFLRTGIEKYSALVKILNPQQSFRESLRIRLEGRHCGVSEEGTAISRLYRLYKQSDIAHCTSIINQTQRIVHYKQLPPNNTAQQLLSQLAQSLIAGNTGLCYIQIEKLVEFCSGGIMLDDVRRIHERVLSLLQRYGKNKVEDLRVRNYHQIFTEYATIPALFEPCKQFFLTSEGRNSEVSAEEILSFIDANFTKNIRIADIASQFHFSQNYFSTFFHKKTGQTFTKYITQKRMEMARQLLENTDLPMQEIADQTGYSDYFQFNKIFKRETGLPPSRYRDTHRKTRTGKGD